MDRERDNDIEMKSLFEEFLEDEGLIEILEDYAFDIKEPFKFLEDEGLIE